MSTVDHLQEPDDPKYLGRAAGKMSRFRPCGGRVGGAAGRPAPDAESFDANTISPVGDFVVGVIDTGLALQDGVPHPFLAGHVDFDKDAEDTIPVSPGILCPDDGHGTFVTGLILREAPSATVRMIRALDLGDNAPDNDAIVAAAIDTLAKDPAVKVINLSFSGDVAESAPPPAIQEALERIRYRQIVVVAAAGNSPTNKDVWPGAFEQVIAVGAVDETPIWLQGAPPPRASFSNYGHWVDAYANGVNVLGPFLNFQETDPDQRFTGWARWSGTSFASAIVAGRIACRAIADGIDAPEAARRVLGAGPRYETPDFALQRNPTYVQSVASKWSLDRAAIKDGCP